MACPLCDDTGWKPAVGRRRSVRRPSASAARRPLRLLARERRPPAAGRREHPQALPALHHRQLHRLQRNTRARRRRRRGAWPSVSRRRTGLFLEGQPGVGKTHLAVAVLKQVVQTTGARGLFYDTRDLLRVIRSTYDPSIRTTELEVLRPGHDRRPARARRPRRREDLGVGRRDDESHRQHPIQRAAAHDLHVELSRTFPTTPIPNSLLFRIGARMRSRLHEMCEFLPMDGADYREMPTNGGVDDLVTLWKTRKKALPARLRSGRQARAQLRDPPSATAEPT